MRDRAEVPHCTTRVWRRFWALALLFVLYASLLPFAFVSDVAVLHEHWAQALTRSAPTELEFLSKADVLQNVLLFVPIGVLGALSFLNARPVRALLLAIGGAAALSAGCELLQLLTVNRVTSAWDWSANVAGAFIGAGLWLVMRPIAVRVGNALPESARERQRVVPLLCAAALVVAAACQPFDLTLDVGTVWNNVKPFLVNGLWTWQPLSDELLTAVRFAMLSFLAAEWIRGSGRPASTARALGVTAVALVAIALEASQFLVASRSPSTQDLLAAWSGAALGVAVAPMVLRAIPGFALVTIATTAAAFPVYLEPFTVSPTYGSFALMPFLAYYQFTSLQTVSHVLDLMLIYAPIGFAAIWSKPEADLIRRTLIVIPIAATLEYSQGWIVGRFPDVTDLGMAVLGGLAGGAVARALAAASTTSRA